MALGDLVEVFDGVELADSRLAGFAEWLSGPRTKAPGLGDLGWSPFAAIGRAVGQAVAAPANVLRGAIHAAPGAAQEVVGAGGAFLRAPAAAGGMALRGGAAAANAFGGGVVRGVVSPAPASYIGLPGTGLPGGGLAPSGLPPSPVGGAPFLFGPAMAAAVQAAQAQGGGQTFAAPTGQGLPGGGLAPGAVNAFANVAAQAGAGILRGTAPAPFSAVAARAVQAAQVAHTLPPGSARALLSQLQRELSVAIRTEAQLAKQIGGGRRGPTHAVVPVATGGHAVVPIAGPGIVPPAHSSVSGPTLAGLLAAFGSGTDVAVVSAQAGGGTSHAQLWSGLQHIVGQRLGAGASPMQVASVASAAWVHFDIGAHVSGGEGPVLTALANRNDGGAAVAQYAAKAQQYAIKVSAEADALNAEFLGLSSSLRTSPPANMKERAIVVRDWIWLGRRALQARVHAEKARHAAQHDATAARLARAGNKKGARRELLTAQSIRDAQVAVNMPTGFSQGDVSALEKQFGLAAPEAAHSAVPTLGVSVVSGGMPTAMPVLPSRSMPFAARLAGLDCGVEAGRVQVESGKPSAAVAGVLEGLGSLGNVGDWFNNLASGIGNFVQGASNDYKTITGQAPAAVAQVAQQAQAQAQAPASGSQSGYSFPPITAQLQPLQAAVTSNLPLILGGLAAVGVAFVALRK